ncbi:hypothetical protein VTK73DRAFT_6553 [Phialemonium thermophilum]|uniref:alpha-1,2-Mannosidase n=1 Tax=Phialemonium thermophilum TaxID=223376 RepID=A0ABR3XWK5_9PEZI
MAFVASGHTLLRLAALAIAGITIAYFLLLSDLPYRDYTGVLNSPTRPGYDWASRPRVHPIPESNLTRLPAGPPRRLPRVQYDFSKDPKDPARDRVLVQRREAVKRAMQKNWDAYRKHAWRHDELRPVSLQFKDPFNGWGATLVDSLDTLWIMGLKAEFKEAVKAVRLIDWDNTTSPKCSVFETNIRYLGGLLSAYELSGQRVLLKKALEVGNMLYAAFDTPNHLPVRIFIFEDAKAGGLVAPEDGTLASVGTLSMEFTKLSQASGDPRFFSAIDLIKRELKRTQSISRLPGMWPGKLNLKDGFIPSGNSFSLGGGGDSAYEYLPKMYSLLGGLDDAYEEMYKKAMSTIEKHALFRAMLPPDKKGTIPDVLFSGRVTVDDRSIKRQPHVEHLGCFAGGLFALGGKLFNIEDHIRIGEQITRGCVWTYAAMPTGVMPENSGLIPCQTSNLTQCGWDEERWKQESRPGLPKGFSAVPQAYYSLRPEAIESVFILYRITGKKEFQDIAWTMFEAIQKATETEFANSAIRSVLATGETFKADSMESFWTAETLKYFYLIFADPALISLDDYVFNTEAHPFKIPKPKKAPRHLY